MALRDEDVAAARRAAAQLEAAAGALARHYGDSVDVRRLHLDAARVSEDLDLLCGRAQAAPVVPPVREVIPDSSYTHDFWMDAEDEGLGSSDRRR